MITHWITKDSPEAEWVQLEAFAATFAHSVNRSLPTIVFIEDGKIVAHCQVSNMPVLFPALPSNDPKNVVKVMHMIRAWSDITYGGANIATPAGGPMIAHMDKLGFEAWPNMVYTRKKD